MQIFVQMWNHQKNEWTIVTNNQNNGLNRAAVLNIHHFLWSFKAFREKTIQN